MQTKLYAIISLLLLWLMGVNLSCQATSLPRLEEAVMQASKSKEYQKCESTIDAKEVRTIQGRANNTYYYRDTAPTLAGMLKKIGSKETVLTTSTFMNGKFSKFYTIDRHSSCTAKKFIVLHFTSSGNTSSPLSQFNEGKWTKKNRTMGASAPHILIGKKEILQLLPFDMASFAAPLEHPYSRLTDIYAINIEIVGWSVKDINSRPDQVQRVAMVVRALMKQYSIPVYNVLGHGEVAKWVTERSRKKNAKSYVINKIIDGKSDVKNLKKESEDSLKSKLLPRSTPAVKLYNVGIEKYNKRMVSYTPSIYDKMTFATVYAYNNQVYKVNKMARSKEVQYVAKYKLIPPYPRFDFKQEEMKLFRQKYLK